MRTTTLPSMLEILTRNYNYRNQDVKLYEVGRTYLPGGEDGLAIESKTLTLGAYGGDMDFYAMKGAIEAILQELRVKDVTFRIGSGLPEELSYHPGRFAEVWSGSDCLGWFGQIHPLVAQNYGADADLYCAELSFDALCAAKEILVPLQCEFFALEGIVKLLQTYEQVKKRLNPQLGLLGVVLTMFDGRNRLTRQVQDEVNRCFPDQIFKTVIPRTVRLSEAPSFGKSILHYDIKSKGSEAYLSLAKEIVMRKPGSRTAKAE